MIESRYPLRPLGDVLELDRDEVEVQPTGTYRTAGIYSFGRGLFERQAVVGSETSYKSLFRLREGQLVVSRLNGWEGALDVVGASMAGAHVSNEYPTFTIAANASQDYLRQLCHWPELWEALAPRGSMVRRKRVQIDQLLETRLPLPEVTEQERVARRIASARATAQHARTRSAITQHLVGSLTASIVNGCRNGTALNMTRLGDVLVQVQRPTQIDLDATYRTIGIRSFGNGLIRYSPKSGADLGKLRFFEVPPDALAISNIKAWEGALTTTVGIETGLTASNRFLFYVPIDDQCEVRFVEHSLLSAEGLRLIGRASPGSADRNRTLATSRFEDIWLELPDPATQRRFGKFLDRVGPTMKHLQSLNDRQVELLDVLGLSILNQAFAGLL